MGATTVKKEATLSPQNGASSAPILSSPDIAISIGTISKSELKTLQGLTRLYGIEFHPDIYEHVRFFDPLTLEQLSAAVSQLQPIAALIFEFKDKQLQLKDINDPNLFIALKSILDAEFSNNTALNEATTLSQLVLAFIDFDKTELSTDLFMTFYKKIAESIAKKYIHNAGLSSVDKLDLSEDGANGIQISFKDEELNIRTCLVTSKTDEKATQGKGVALRFSINHKKIMSINAF